MVRVRITLNVIVMERRIYEFRGAQVSFRKEYYCVGGSLAVRMVDESTNQSCILTVNLCSPLQDGSRLAFLNINNHPDMLDWLCEKGLAEPTHFSSQSGFCTYPLLSFHPELF